MVTPVISSTMRKTCSSGWPIAASRLQPVSCSAMGFMKVTRITRSVQITASPIERRVMCSRSFSSNSARFRRRCSVMSQFVPTSARVMPRRVGVPVLAPPPWLPSSSSSWCETMAMARTWRTSPVGHTTRYSVSKRCTPRIAWRISVLTRLTSSGCSMAIHCASVGAPSSTGVPCSACMRASQVMVALVKSHSQMPTPPASTASSMRRASCSMRSWSSLRRWMSSTWAM
ncbi:hypothetical protein D3C72_1029950 [compost metagenome]